MRKFLDDLTEGEILRALDKRRHLCETVFMHGTTAHHLLGNISRPAGDVFVAAEETNDYWIGSWVTGFGYFNVLFPKETSRPLSDQELSYYNSSSQRQTKNIIIKQDNIT